MQIQSNSKPIIMKRILTIFLLVMTVTVITQAQTVTGNVTDESGVPLTGASVIEKGTTNGSIDG